MGIRRRIIKWIHNKVPGKFLGNFRFLPIFFVAGGLLEYTMIHWHAGGEVNFYNTYKKKRIEEAVQERLRNEIRSRAQNANT
ncbi:ubiquinol-cytochrome c reductase complex assembly factor 5 [Megalopta genalis]|uniref:ubiquinol-cytochrome c reductase complex assembly factor 5 n=1 Tax=Megalopta genalis TaxID=115081 RepID=UPI001443131A|nr:small integral membrane protein 4 [Megalopta genalis]